MSSYNLFVGEVDEFYEEYGAYKRTSSFYIKTTSSLSEGDLEKILLKKITDTSSHFPVTIDKNVNDEFKIIFHRKNELKYPKKSDDPWCTYFHITSVGEVDDNIIKILEEYTPIRFVEIFDDA